MKDLPLLSQLTERGRRSSELQKVSEEEERKTTASNDQSIINVFLQTKDTKRIGAAAGRFYSVCSGDDQRLRVSSDQEPARRQDANE